MRAYIIASSQAAVNKSSLVGPTFASHEIEIIFHAPSFGVGRTLLNEACSQKTLTSFPIPSLLANGLHTLKSLPISCFEVTGVHTNFTLAVIWYLLNYTSTS